VRLAHSKVRLVIGLSIRSFLCIWKVGGTYRCVWHIQCDKLIDKTFSLENLESAWNITGAFGTFNVISLSIRPFLWKIWKVHGTYRCVWHIQGDKLIDKTFSLENLESAWNIQVRLAHTM
jgi:hypothetical protein